MVIYAVLDSLSKLVSETDNFSILSGTDNLVTLLTLMTACSDLSDRSGLGDFGHTVTLMTVVKLMALAILHHI